MKSQTFSLKDSATWAENFVCVFQKLKPYRKVRSVITVRNNSSSTLKLEAAFVSKGVFDQDPGVGEPLGPNEVRLFPVKTSAGMPGYEFYGLWRALESAEGDSFTAITACRWGQPKSFKAVTPPDVRVGLTRIDGFSAFLKKKAFSSLKHDDIASGTGATHFGRVRQIVKEDKFTNKDREGVFITGISAVNSEFFIADVETGASRQRKKPKLVVGKAAAPRKNGPVLILW